MKRVIIILCLLFSLFLVGCQSTNNNKNSLLNYVLMGDDTYCVTAASDFKGRKKIIIPATYNGKSVTKISDSAFSNGYMLENIVIPASVTSIGDYAFEGCLSLTSIVIPESVTSIGKRAFATNNFVFTIYCEVSSKPSGWRNDWNGDNNQVIWGYKG